MSEFYFIEAEANSDKEAIKLCADVLHKNGCVLDDFYNSCIERESTYPTGLTDYCPVALPHTSKDHVLKEAICVLRLKNPVKFHSMEDINQEIDVKIVINMALLDDAEHIQIISRIVNNLKQPSFVDNLLNYSSEKLVPYLKDTLFTK